MTYTKQEALSLLDKSEAEQYEWLEEHNILLGEHIRPDGNLGYESLAECAFRLRDEIVQDDVRYNDYSWGFWLSQLAYRGICPLESEKSKPIHWIVAALLARLESK